MPSKRKNTKAPSAAGQLLKPGLLAGAAAFSWAAVNMPAMLTPAAAIVWGLGTLTVGLLARTVLALAFPGITILLVQLARAIDQFRAPGEKS